MKHIRFAKLVAAILLVAMLTMTFASCSFEIGPASVKTSVEPAPTPEVELRDPYSGLDTYDFIIGDTSLVNQYTEADEEAIRQTIDQLNALLEEGIRQRQFIDLYLEFEEQYEYLLQNLSLASIEYYVLKSKAESQDNYLYLTSLQSEIAQLAIQMYPTIYESPFRDAFYEGWTEEEIQDALFSAEIYTDEYKEMRDLDDQYLVAYRELNPSTDRDAIAELYIEFVKNKNAMARQLGYEDYMDYAYAEVYARDYGVDEVSAAVEMIKQITPFLPICYEKYSTTMGTLNAQEQAEFIGFVQNRKITNNANKEFLRDFYAMLNDEAVALYDDVWAGGHYFITGKARKSYEGAFTTTIYGLDRPIMYFGPGYQDMSTFVHEFGHYMAEFMSTADDLNFDLAEIQSQGGEMLFLRYLQTGNFSSKKAADLTAYYSLLNMLLTVSLATSVNVFETYVYENIDTIEADDLQGIFEDAVNEIVGLDVLSGLVGATASNYWALVCVENPGYYISYAMSALPALSLYATAGEDYDAAVDLYFQLLAVDTDGFCSELEEIGMNTPFDAELYAAILNCFREEFID